MGLRWLATMILARRWYRPFQELTTPITLGDGSWWVVARHQAAERGSLPPPAIRRGVKVDRARGAEPLRPRQG